ncbi:MAG TPA: hypothetical protein VNU46_06030 [Gemmatimonadaceae bacterium]|jgi:hypothetical protein|nr:hypothetical protein [Gemmatimonadaceae bacterium]
MLRRNIRYAGFLVTLSSSLATAQHPTTKPQQVNVWFTTAHVKARTLDVAHDNMPGSIEWASVRTLGWGTVHRVDFNPDSSTGEWGAGQILPIGSAWLSTGTDTMTSMMILDSAKKKYFFPTLHSGLPMMGLLQYHNPADTTPHTSPNDPVSRIVDLTVTIDSLGPGPTIRGHPTLQYRQTQRATVETTLGKMMAITIKMEGQEDLDIATDIPNAPPIDGQGVQRIAEFAVELAITPKLVPAIHSATVKYPHGVILHMDGRQTIGSPQGPLVRIMTMDADQWGTMSVDASLFTTPPSYTRGESEFMQ